MAINFNGTTITSTNDYPYYHINFNGCSVCTVLNNGQFVWDRQCVELNNNTLLYGYNQTSGPACNLGANTCGYYTKPARYICVPVSLTKGYQLLVANDCWTAYNLWADTFFQMHSNVRIDDPNGWHHVYAAGGCPLCYSFVGCITAYSCVGFCVVSTNFGTLCQKLIPLPGVVQQWTNLWTCWKPFTANPTLCLCNPSMQATMRTPGIGSGLIWGAFDGTYTATGCTCIHPIDVWVAYYPQTLVVCYNSGVTRNYPITIQGCCPGLHYQSINMCFS